ncbi:hypothetical protein F5B18DRAFT_648886 [Nemania serpens]|nr:hypothetical protein F5B18DRAFT_648886 [Nemania serpens]
MESNFRAELLENEEKRRDEVIVAAFEASKREKATEDGLLRCFRSRVRLAEEDQAPLASEHEIMKVYLDDRRLREAILIPEQVAAV